MLEPNRPFRVRVQGTLIVGEPQSGMDYFAPDMCVVVDQTFEWPTFFPLPRKGDKIRVEGFPKPVSEDYVTVSVSSITFSPNEALVILEVG